MLWSVFLADTAILRNAWNRDLLKLQRKKKRMSEALAVKEHIRSLGDRTATSNQSSSTSQSVAEREELIRMGKITPFATDSKKGKSLTFTKTKVIVYNAMAGSGVYLPFVVL